MSLKSKRLLDLGPENSISESVSEIASESFADRLVALIGEGSRNAFAKKCGIGETSLRQYLDGGTPGLDKVVQIAKAENVSVHWLATGEGPPRLQPQGALTPDGTEREHGGRMQVESMELRAIDADMVYLPQLNVTASAGLGVVPPDEQVENFIAIKREYLRYIDVSPAHAHITTLGGHSMKPTLLDRDLIIVDTSKTEVLNERIYAVMYGETVLAKRIQILWDGSLRLMSDNKADGYTDEVVSAEDRDKVHIVGQIKGYLRHF